MAKEEKVNEEEKEEVIPELPPLLDAEEYWDGVLADLESGGGNFLFFKEGKHRIRLLAPLGATHPSQMFAKTSQEYQGKARPKFIFYCYRPDDLKDPNILDEDLVKIAIAPKTLWRGVVNMLKEGYDFFGPSGHGIVAVRTGTGLASAYTAMPSPKAVAISPKVTLALGERTILEAVKEWEKFQADQAINPPEPSGQPADSGDDSLGGSW